MSSTGSSHLKSSSGPERWHCPYTWQKGHWGERVNDRGCRRLGYTGGLKKNTMERLKKCKIKFKEEIIPNNGNKNNNRTSQCAINHVRLRTVRI